MSLPLLDQNLTPCAGQMRALHLGADGQAIVKKPCANFGAKILGLCLSPPGQTDAFFDFPHLLETGLFQRAEEPKPG